MHHRRKLIWIALTLVVAAAWIAGGRHLTLLVDRLVTGNSETPAPGPVRYDGGSLVFGALPLTLCGVDNQRAAIEIGLDAAGMARLSAAGESFVLGPGTRNVELPGSPDIAVSEASGLVLTRSQSLLSWPTPFEIRILGGASPWWKRYVYYRLAWQKGSGARLTMVWRYEQRWYSASGWGQPAMMFNFETGLLSTAILPSFAEIASRYLLRTKGWREGEYRLESRGVGADGRTERFAAIHGDDARAAAPGAGKSVEVSVERTTRRVTGELAGQ